MKCPRCKLELKPGNVDDYGLTCNAHVCETCKGMWIGAGTLKDIEMTTEHTFVEFRRIPSPVTQMETLNCPQCDPSPPMEKVENERDRKVVMDVCPNCKNIWLDGGEKEAIQQEGLGALIADAVHWMRTH